MSKRSAFLTLSLTCLVILAFVAILPASAGSSTTDHGKGEIWSPFLDGPVAEGCSESWTAVSYAYCTSQTAKDHCADSCVEGETGILSSVTVGGRCSCDCCSDGASF